MLEIAKRELANVEFIQQDITQDALPKKYDVATAFRFFTNAEEQLKSDALAAIADALSDDGILVANIHVNRSSVVGWCYRLRNRMAGRLTARVVGHDEFADLLGQHGFEIVRTHWYSYLPRTGWRFPWLARYLMKPVEWICARNPLVPRSVASCFIVVCRKKRTATLAPRAA